MSSKSVHTIYVTLLTTSLLCIGARAQSLQDFVDADKEEGCKSIPYSTQRQNCSSLSGDVESWCKNSSRPRSCKELNLEAITKNIESVSEKRKRVEEDRSRATTDDEKRRLQEESDKLARTIEDLQHKVSNDKDEIKKRIDNGEHCRDYRGKVQAEFFEAGRKADSESDPAIKPIAQKLMAKWKVGMVDHVRDYQAAVDVLEDCKNQLR